MGDWLHEKLTWFLGLPAWVKVMTTAPSVVASVGAGAVAYIKTAPLWLLLLVIVVVLILTGAALLCVALGLSGGRSRVVVSKRTTLPVADGPQLELRGSIQFAQRVESWGYYALVVSNERVDYQAPAYGIKVSLFFEHARARPIEVPGTILLNRNESRFTKEVAELRSRDSVEVIVVVTPYGHEFYAMRSYPLNLLEEDKLTEGAWTCRVQVSGANFNSFSKTYRFEAWPGQPLSLREVPNA
jgi:hypothetical protein